MLVGVGAESKNTHENTTIKLANQPDFDWVCLLRSTRVIALGLNRFYPHVLFVLECNGGELDMIFLQRRGLDYLVGSHYNAWDALSDSEKIVQCKEVAWYRFNLNLRWPPSL
jgi:hypothetical protein